jgi:sarcosine oxidase
LSTHDVAVIGAGAVGSATAWWLARRGKSVVVLERFEAGHNRGSSHGTGCIFRLGYAEPTYVALAREALPLWRELEEDAGAELITTIGMLDFGDPHELDRLVRACESAVCASSASRRPRYVSAFEG